MRSLVVLAVLATMATARAAPRLDVVDGVCALDGLHAAVEALDAKLSRRADAPAIRISTQTSENGVVAVVMAETGRREVEAASCSELVDALALVIAMMAPTIADAPVESIVEEVTTLVAAPPPRERRWSIVGGVSGSRTSQAWMTRALLGSRWQRGRRAFGIEVAIANPHRETVGEGTISIWDASITVVPCLHVSGVNACATATGGWIHGTGMNLAAASDATSPLFALGTRVEWELPLTTHVGLRAHLGAQMYLTTTRFDVDHMVEWAHDRVEALGGISAVAHFP